MQIKHEGGEGGGGVVEVHSSSTNLFQYGLICANHAITFFFLSYLIIEK
jgi:hypothetical protein